MPDLFPETKCPHETLTVVLTPQLIHYGKRICAKCGHFEGWERNPDNIAKDAENAQRLDVLNKKVETDWEKQFVFSLIKQGRGFSPKQLEFLNKLWKQYGN